LKLLAQRVLNSSIKISEKKISSIDKGILALVGFERNDNLLKCQQMAKKLVSYRMFPDIEGKMEKSILEAYGEILLVPQITLAMETDKGNRPSFSEAANPEEGKKLFDVLAREINKFGVSKLELGIFGADMEISLINDGPVTFIFQK
jgi:D-tyrosyl-tRNA(Tyr) deacylase|tara:strand:+ start:3633 stop:4073 length:441 start_codon:yes stop_codon:yes gene_type:complete